MPIYEYECTACGFNLEKLQKISAEPLQDCPECNTASLARLVSAPRFKLKGDGWYETDFKTKKTTETDTPNTKPSTTTEKTKASTASTNKTDKSER